MNKDETVENKNEKNEQLTEQKSKQGFKAFPLAIFIGILFIGALLTYGFLGKYSSSTGLTGNTVTDIQKEAEKQDQINKKNMSLQPVSDPAKTESMIQEQAKEVYIPQFSKVFSTTFPGTVSKAIDVNQDGFLDLLLGDTQEQAVLLINKKEMRFERDASFHFGILDVLDCYSTKNHPFPECVGGSKNNQYFLLKNQKGTFTKQELHLQLQGPITVMRYGDYNNDALTDIFIGTYKQQNELIINKGNGEFISSEQFDVGDVSDMQIIDMNKDGFIDVVLSTYGGKALLYINTGKSVGNPFKKPIAISEEGLTTRQMVITDINNDGYFDVLLAMYAKQSVLLVNNKNGTFTARTPFEKDFTQAASAGDLNKDGWQDIVLGTYNGNTYMYINRGDLTFEKQILTTGLVRSVIIDDFNNDGDQDIFVGKANGDSELFMNTALQK